MHQHRKRKPNLYSLCHQKNYIKYDFFSPRKFTKEKMKILRSVFENYARILTSQINGIFRVMTDITVLDVQERRYYEYVNALHENDCMTMIDASIAGEEKMSVPLMLFVTPGMVITLINHMLGGEDVVAVEDDYRYSDVERALYKRIVEYMTGTLKDGFSNYVSIVFSVEHVEENPTMVQDVGLDETVAIIILNVDISGQAQEKLKICLPGNLLTVIFHSIDNRKHLARGFSYQDNKEKIMDNIRYSKLPITGQLGTVQLDLKGLYQIQVGDVIDLGKPKDSPVRLFVGRQPWFTGQMGCYKKNVAVKIEKCIASQIEEKKTDIMPQKEEDPDNSDGSVKEQG